MKTSDAIKQFEKEVQQMRAMVEAIAGCVKFSESEHPERTEHAAEILDGIEPGHLWRYLDFHKL